MTIVRDTICAAVAATVLLAMPGMAPAASEENAGAPEQTVTQAAPSAAEEASAPGQGAAEEGGQTSEALALVRSAVAPTKPKAVRPPQTSIVRAAPVSHHYSDCIGSWCGRQIVLMLGVGY